MPIKNPSSTSLNKISGDVPSMGFLQKLAWHSMNFIDNHIPDKLESSSVKVKKLKVSQEDLYPIIQKMPSSKILPRALSDIFWQILPWKDIKATLGPLNVLDIGCGSARIYVEFLSLTKEISDDLHYTGVDIETCPDWVELQQKYPINLKKDDICNYLKSSNFEHNFIVSQSVLEHVEFDYFTHALIADFIKSSRKKVIQVHLVPAVACHKIYGIHGFRHYNLRKLSTIASLYETFSDCYIFPLGNKQVNAVHCRWAMGSSRDTLRFTKQTEYVKKFRETLLNYFANTVVDKEPTFYALVIESNNQEQPLNWGN